VTTVPADVTTVPADVTSNASPMSAMSTTTPVESLDGIDVDEHGNTVRIDPMLWMMSLGLGLNDLRQLATVPPRELVKSAMEHQSTRLLTGRAVAEQLGVTIEEMELIRRSLGLTAGDPDEVAYGPEDVALHRTFSNSNQLFSRDELLHFGQVVGSSIARIADAAISMFRTDVEVPLTEAGVAPMELAKLNVHALADLERLSNSLPTLLWSHMALSSQRARTMWASSDSIDTGRMAIGFVDLVGFTPLSASLPARELDLVIREFERRAHTVVSDHGGRVVKLIGDEVMFVALDAASATAAALELIGGFAGNGNGPCVTPRGGVAVGDVLTRGGDYYGPIVNLAARIGELAVPMELLVTTEAAAEAASLGSTLVFEPAGRRQLKGFSDPVALCSITSDVAPCGQ
jgi:adenylate cyclase